MHAIRMTGDQLLRINLVAYPMIRRLRVKSNAKWSAMQFDNA